jgi:LacI family transcriptional regulator
MVRWRRPKPEHVSKDKKRSVTLADVARLAGVSTSTVSRSLSAPHMVRPAVRETVDWAVRRLGYIPHGPARALARRSHATVGVVIPSLRFNVYADLVESLQGALGSAGLSVLLGHAGNDMRYEHDQAVALASRGMDALVLVGNTHDEDVIRVIENAQIPVVTTFGFKANAQFPCVGIDNVAAGREIGAHLLSLGHADVGAIMPDIRRNDRAAERLRGLRECLAASGRSMRTECVRQCDALLDESRAEMAALLELAHPPSAVVCFSDLVALAALTECRARRIGVPGQISLAGFSGIGLAELANPPITTVSFSASEIGRHAAQLVLAGVRGHAAQHAIRVDHHLSVRESTARPPA